MMNTKTETKKIKDKDENKDGPSWYIQAYMHVSIYMFLNDPQRNRPDQTTTKTMKDKDNEDDKNKDNNNEDNEGNKDNEDNKQIKTTKTTKWAKLTKLTKTTKTTKRSKTTKTTKTTKTAKTTKTPLFVSEGKGKVDLILAWCAQGREGMAESPGFLSMFDNQDCVAYS